MLLQIILTVLLLVLLAYVAFPKKPSGIPPGKWGWPVIGTLPSGNTALSDQVLELQKKHGDILSWRMGNRLFIFLCNFKLIRAAFSSHEAEDRPDFYSLQQFAQLTNNGVANISGYPWQVNRRFTLRHLKDLGMGKSHLGKAIEEEAGHLVQDFKKRLDKPIEVPWSVSVAVLNVIWQLSAGSRYDVDNKRVTEFSKIVLTSARGMEGSVVWLDFFPQLLSVLPFPVRSWLGMHQIYNSNIEIYNFIMDEILNERVANLNPDKPKDFIDAYLVEMEAQKDDPETVMSLAGLCHLLVDLFSAGSLTTAVTLRWSILYLAKYPDVQKKAQKQIDEVVSRDVLPSFDQKEQLPYVDALANEVSRLSTLAPLGVPHSNKEDMELGGYNIPKNSVLVGHFECCHKDPTYWEKPDEFYPEHFLDENGKVSWKREGFLPFSVGRRACVGESLARMELFVFVAALIQNFTFTAPVGEKLSIEKSPHDRIVNFPKPFKVVISARK